MINVLAFGGIGGAEKFVLSLCQNHSKTRFEIIVCVLFGGGIISNEIAQMGYELAVMNMKNGFDIKKALRIVRFLRRKKAAIVNIHGQNPLGKLCSILSGAQVVIHTDHGTTLGSPVKRRSRVVLSNRLLTPFIDHFIAISKGMKKSLQMREKIPEKKISLIYNGVDVNHISKISVDKHKLRRSLGIPSSVPIVGTIGRLAPEKMYPFLLQSLSDLKKQDVRFTCLIVGDGPDRENLQFLVKQMNLQKDIHFLGMRKDAIQLLDLMDVFLLSSGGEAFSITILEAMAKGKPIVAFDVEGVDEAVVNGQTGFLVPFGDVYGFAKKTKTLLQNPELANHMGHSAFKRASAFFNLKKNIQKLESLYESFL